MQPRSELRVHRLATRVALDVRVIVTAAGERSSTHSTLVWPLTRVDPHVSHEVRLPCEALPTHATHVLLLSTVLAKMEVHRTSTRELATAHLARVLLALVCGHVYAQVTRSRVRLPALRTFVRTITVAEMR